jgi:hypothetical protein
MAYCPECKGEMPLAAVECPHCEFRCPATAAYDSNRRPGFAWSPLADIALSVSTVAAVLATLCAFYLGVISLFAGNLFDALVVAPISVLILLGIVVVFLRVQELD